MTKDDVVEMMTNVVEHESLKIAKLNNLPEDQVIEYNRQARDSVKYFNSVLYDTLSQAGLLVTPQD